eukprot:SAG31_NODE_3714_length_3957_cov_3.388025_5_plen_37_part_01
MDHCINNLVAALDTLVVNLDAVNLDAASLLVILIHIY